MLKLFLNKYPIVAEDFCGLEDKAEGSWLRDHGFNPCKVDKDKTTLQLNRRIIREGGLYCMFVDRSHFMDFQVLRIVSF